MYTICKFWRKKGHASIELSAKKMGKRRDFSILEEAINLFSFTTIRNRLVSGFWIGNLDKCRTKFAIYAFDFDNATLGFHRFIVFLMS